MLLNTATDPAHYQQGSIQPLDFIMANNLGFCEGNIIKYLVRYQSTKDLNDLRKAEVYLARLIEHEEASNDQRAYLASGR